jgi:hypothetical protein
MDDNGETKILPFTERDGVRKHDDSPEGDTLLEAVATGDAYATIAGQRYALSLEFIRRNGESFTVPYSYRPLLWWRSPETLIMEYPGLFSVVLRGQNLSGLAARIRDHKITWVREIDPLPTATAAAAVTSIEIIRAYPSHAETLDELSTPPPTPA